MIARTVIALLFAALWTAVCDEVWAADRDEKIVNERPDNTWSRLAGGMFTSAKSVAVVIGISEYVGEGKGGYPALLSAAADAGKMVKFLKEDAGFDIIYVLTELDFGRFRRREREHFPCAARYGTEFLYCLGLAGT